MQDTMNKLMGDMWKSVGDMNAVNWMKDISSVNDMDPKKIGLQLLGFQKSALDNAYNAMQQIQQQAEKMAEPLLKNIPGVPEELKNMLKINQEAIKKAVDESFIKAESYFSPASGPVKEAKPIEAETTKGKAESKAK